MKKRNKKISILVKVVLMVCMIFSQLATPIEVLADQMVPSYSVSLTLDANTNKFIVKSNGTELVEEENYILEIIRSFSFKNTDGTLNAEKQTNTPTYKVVLGSVLNQGITDIEHETFYYNGVSYVDVNIYEITTEDTIDFSTYSEEVHKNLLAEEKITDIISTSFEEGISNNKTSLEFSFVNENLTCETIQGYKCSFIKNDINNIVEINYNLERGNFNPNKKYHTVLKVNDVTMELITEDIDVEKGKLLVDFSKLLPGVYNFEYSVRDNDNIEIISNVIEFTYNDKVIEEQNPSEGEVSNDNIQEETEEFDRLGFIKNAELAPEVFYSYTILTEEEKNTLGNDYRFLDNKLAYLFDKIVSNDNISLNYNLFENATRYHVITSNKFIGVFSEEYNNNAYKVNDVLNSLNISLLPRTTIIIVDSNGQIVNGDAYIQNGMKLIVNTLGETLEYDFLVYGDVDGNYVENSDLSVLIDKILNNNFHYYDVYNLDLNKDGIININDISILGANIGLQDYDVNNDFEIVDNLSSNITLDKNEIFATEEFEVLLSLNGFTEEGNYINALEGIINYDKEALTLKKVEIVNDLFLGNTVADKLIYATSGTYSTNEEALIKLTFTGNIEGLHKISVKDLNLIADGKTVSNITSNEIEIKVNRPLHTDATLKSLYSSAGYFTTYFNSEVLDYTLYVDSSVYYLTLSGELNDEYATTDDLKQYVLTGDNTWISINVTAEDGTVKTYRVNVIKVYKSSNNNLSDITIDGYEIDFNKDILEYKINVGSDVTSLNINALVEHYGAWAKIEGNENFQEGENVVTITVYAENGNSKAYKLLVNKAKEEEQVVVDDEEEDNKNNVNTEKIVIIILIVLVVIGLLYLIFKKDEEQEPRIEQIKPKDNKK